MAANQISRRRSCSARTTITTVTSTSRPNRRRPRVPRAAVLLRRCLAGHTAAVAYQLSDNGVKRGGRRAEMAGHRLHTGNKVERVEPDAHSEPRVCSCPRVHIRIIRRRPLRTHPPPNPQTGARSRCTISALGVHHSRAELRERRRGGPHRPMASCPNVIEIGFSCSSRQLHRRQTFGPFKAASAQRSAEFDRRLRQARGRWVVDPGQGPHRRWPRFFDHRLRLSAAAGSRLRRHGASACA